MNHAYMYHGGFESNFALLKPGAKTFKGSDGTDHALPGWPAEVDGVRIGYMEMPAKRFVAVRVVDARADIVLKNEVLIDQNRHMGAGKRFGHEPTVVGDEPMWALLGEAIRKNPDQKAELDAVRGRMKAK